MKLYILDAFTAQPFGGNQAGVALLGGEDFPPDGWMRTLAAELRHSETAFVRMLDGGRFHLRFFTPTGEVDLCGHATIAAFTLLRERGLGHGAYTAVTLAGNLNIQVTADTVWMDMAPPVENGDLKGPEADALYAAYGLTPEDRPNHLWPAIVSTGLRDILLPVKDASCLDRAVQDEGEVVRLSRLHNVVGVHMFCLAEEAGVTAHCRNFAPLYAIPEEAATGTSNGALTFYLWRRGLVLPGNINVFFQGERMGRPSVIRSRLLETEGGASIQVGGSAVSMLRCDLLGTD